MDLLRLETAQLYTVKTKVCTTHQNVTIHTLNVQTMCVLGHFSVQYTLSFLQCNSIHLPGPNL